MAAENQDFDDAAEASADAEQAKKDQMQLRVALREALARRRDVVDRGNATRESAELAALTFVEQNTRTPEPITGGPRRIPFEVMLLDYQQTCDQIKMLTDIRFRLLAFVPSAVAIGASVLAAKATGSSGGMQLTVADHLMLLSIGAVGFCAALGVVIYDMRNSQLYNGHVHRAKILEGVLGCVGSGKEVMWPPPSVSGGKKVEQVNPAAPIPDEGYTLAYSGGVHTQRAVRSGRLFGILDVSHGPALALVYGAALGALIFPTAKSLGVLVGVGLAAWAPTFRDRLSTGGSGTATSMVAFGAAVIAGSYFYSQLKALDSGADATFLGYRKPDEAGWKRDYKKNLCCARWSKGN